MIEEAKVVEAVKVLCQVLREDPDSYRAWKDNIAMAIKDQWRETLEVNSDTIDFDTLHEISNKAADRFLRLLTHNGMSL